MASPNRCLPPGPLQIYDGLDHAGDRLWHARAYIFRTSPGTVGFGGAAVSRSEQKPRWRL